ncbi:MAG TPA: hypothetical protein VFN67_33275 [Polyangiales bacterium]|nr:hypothetical protein [Polyangiales bacterium]
MSESRPLANTLPGVEEATCPLFAEGPETRAPNWSVSTFGLAVVAITLGEACMRLGARALVTLHSGLSLYESVLFFSSIAAFGYGEGYRALHQRFVPHVIERAILLARSDIRGFRGFSLAALYVLCLVHAERRERVKAWISVALIVCAVVIVKALPEPYRGIIDAGVAVALAIGLGSLISGFVAAVRSTRG